MFFDRLSRIASLVARPSKASRRLEAAFHAWRDGKQYVASPLYRSESENGAYVAAVASAVRSERRFDRFKQDPAYRAVLEHVSRGQGADYLELVRRESPDLLSAIASVKKNDWVGSPTLYHYPEIGEISPTTLRYLKVASDLRLLFGDLSGFQVAEIGGGYGGQLLVADNVLRWELWTIYDLAPVLALISKYLERHLLRGSYGLSSLNQGRKGTSYDLVVSNYAFSELPAPVQSAYLHKIMSRAKRGYLTMNSGRGLSVFDKGKQTLDQLREHLPPFELLEERPLTFPGNYIIVWGRDRSIAAGSLLTETGALKVK